VTRPDASGMMGTTRLSGHGGNTRRDRELLAPALRGKAEYLRDLHRMNDATIPAVEDEDDRLQ